jgi:hypothetical protein
VTDVIAGPSGLISVLVTTLFVVNRAFVRESRGGFESPERKEWRTTSAVAVAIAAGLLVIRLLDLTS